jgi:hypothetical protein
MKKTFLVIIITLIITSLFAVPNWYRNPRAFDPLGEFIIGVGEGTSYEEASRVAKAELVQQITVTVRTDTRVQYVSMESESGAFYAEYINQNIRLTSEQQLVGVETMNQTQIGDRFYVMVALNKLRMLGGMQDQMNEIWGKVRASLNNADRHNANGQLVFALDGYAETQRHLSDLIAKKFLHDSLATRPFQIQGMISDTDIENKVRDLIAAINFEVISGNQQTGRRGSLLPEPIVFQATVRQVGGGTRTHLSGLPIKIFLGDGTEIESGLTDNNGEYSIFVQAIPQTGDRGRISIQINPARFPSFYNRILRNKSTDAHFRVTESEPVNVRLTVVDENNRTLPAAITPISRILANSNVTVRDDGPLFIRGKVTVGNRRMVEGMGAPQHLVNVNLDLEVGVVHSNEVVGILRGSGSGMSNRSEQDSINIAVQNVNFSSRELLTMLERAQVRMGQPPIVTQPVVTPPVVVVPPPPPAVTPVEIPVTQPPVVQPQRLSIGTYTFRQDQTNANPTPMDEFAYQFRPRAKVAGQWQNMYVSKIEVHSEFIYIFFERQASGGNGSGSDGASWWSTGRATLTNFDTETFVRNSNNESNSSGNITSVIFPRPRDGSMETLRFSLHRGERNSDGLIFTIVDLSKAIFTPPN